MSNYLSACSALSRGASFEERKAFKETWLSELNKAWHTTTPGGSSYATLGMEIAAIDWSLDRSDLAYKIYKEMLGEKSLATEVRAKAQFFAANILLAKWRAQNKDGAEQDLVVSLISELTQAVRLIDEAKYPESTGDRADALMSLSDCYMASKQTGTVKELWKRILSSREWIDTLNEPSREALYIKNLNAYLDLPSGNGSFPKELIELKSQASSTISSNYIWYRYIYRLRSDTSEQRIIKCNLLEAALKENIKDDWWKILLNEYAFARSARGDDVAAADIWKTLVVEGPKVFKTNKPSADLDAENEYRTMLIALMASLERMGAQGSADGLRSQYSKYLEVNRTK